MFDQPDIRPISPDKYRLETTYVYEWVSVGGARNRIIIPGGFENDGASVPRLLWSFVRPDGLIRAGALVHDWLCAHAGGIPQNSHQVFHAGEWVPAGITWTRAQGDAMFRHVNREAGVLVRKVRVTYWAVRAGSWMGWKDRGDSVAKTILANTRGTS